MKPLFFTLLCLLWMPVALPATPLRDWQVYEAGVRDGIIARPEMELKLAPLVAAVSSFIVQDYDLAAGAWTFPVSGYGVSAFDRHDYKPAIRYGPEGKKGYDFFDGNKHGGHPAYDIFIRDRNRDTLDDLTGKPVDALAMTDAVVLSTHEGWAKGSPLRGGNYVWLYNPGENKFFYYAHLQRVLVKPGQRVRAGEAVGSIGRTGVLAARKRSRTHLHLMVLEYRDGKLVPYDYYRMLKT